MSGSDPTPSRGRSAHISSPAAPELRGFAGDREVGEHLDVGAAGPGRRHGERDLGAGGAVATLVLALGVHHEAVRRVVLLHEGAGAVVDERDRPELDLHRAAERVTLGRGNLGSREALRYGRDVLEVRPGLLDRGGDAELVCEIHQGVSRALSPCGSEHRSAREYAGQVAPVVGVTVEVRRRVGALRRPLEIGRAHV